jgi:shikimate 5-dehydrogenase
MAEKSSFAVLGTGVIGTGIALSLLREGHSVTVWNRTAERARPLAERGATVVGTCLRSAGGHQRGLHERLASFVVSLPAAAMRPAAV